MALDLSKSALPPPAFPPEPHKEENDPWAESDSVHSSSLQLHECQVEVFRSTARFRILVAGRRFGKTHLALIEMLMAAQKPGCIVWYVGPSDMQSKRVAWVRLKALTKPYWARTPMETELRIELIWGSTIVVNGAFRPDKLRGEGIDFLVLDEYASQSPQAWQEVFRPALSDRKGRALFIGTPKGRNHFYDLVEKARETAHWQVFQYTTAQSGRVDEEELLTAAYDLDEDTFKQEYEGSFALTGKHRAYYAFDRALHVKPVSYNGWGGPLLWSIDFNVNPMCMLLMQQEAGVLHVLEEIVIKPGAHTQMACDRFLERARVYYDATQTFQRPLTVRIYGDASGNQRRTSAGAKTDWSIVRSFFELWRGTFEPKYFAAASNPAVRDRVNCVNSRLKNRLDEVRILIDPQCKELIRDLEEVAWEVDATGARTGELNKKDPARTHASDALGYYISHEFPLKQKIGEKGDGAILPLSL